MSELPSNIEQEVTGITLKGNSFDVKIGYNKRAAAKRDLTLVLQDVEGTPLTDESNAPLITTVEGFVVSELTTDKALSVVFPTETRIVSKFFTILFGQSFEVKKTQNPGTQQQIDPYVKVINPEGTYKYIRKDSRIEIATGAPIVEPDPNNPPLGTRPEGNNFEQFIVQNVVETPGSVSNSGFLEVTYTLNADPSFENPVTYMRRVLQKERTGIIKIEEQFATTSEVSSSLLGIPRAETQLGLFSNVSTYGFNADEFVFYTDNPSTGPTVWSNRATESGETHNAARVTEVKNEGALRLESFPVPYTFPYPPLTQTIGPDGNDTLGLFNETAWSRWQNFVQLGKSLYEYYLLRRDLQAFSGDPTSNYQKYDSFLSRFLPAINIWDDNNYYNGLNYNNNESRYYTRIAVWTDTWKLIKSGDIIDPVSNDVINFAYLSELSLNLRGTGRFTDINAGSIENQIQVPTDPADPLYGKVTYNPFKETWKNIAWSNADTSGGGSPDQDDFIPGYSATGGQYALLQSRQAFRYQPGRISGYTFGTRAYMDKTEGANYAEWGIFNDFDDYVFRREGANFFIVRRSTIHYPPSFLQELGLADELGTENPSFVSYYDKEIGGKIYTFQEIKLSKERFNGDSLNGNGPSGYLLNTDEITMYKIEFGWYGAIGLRMFAYVPIDNGEARWVVVHTFVIENKLNVPSMGDPFFRFKYELRIGAGQAPDLVEPQVLYKYGTSMYIDGGDEGTVSVFSETSDEKLLPTSGNYTSIFGVYPKNFITSGGGVPIPNKKIIIPKQMSITADGFAEINVIKCRACQGSGFLYMPNVTAGQHGDIRKLQKLDSTQFSNDVTLAPIDKVVNSTVTNSTTINLPNADYLRPGDKLTDQFNGVTIPGIPGTPVPRIVSISDGGGGSFDIELDQAVSLNATDNVTFQPVFIVDQTTRKAYNLDYDDFESKIIYNKIWNTYIGNQLTNDGATVNLLNYIDGDRHNLDYERRLDPTKIGVFNQTTNTIDPADFFGDFNTETFDVRLSQRKTIIASPNGVSGPLSFVKFLNPYSRESGSVGSQITDWRIGFTPNRPVFGVNGEITSWIKPDGETLTEERNGDITDVVLLPENEYVYLDYHPYSQGVTTTGLENGEGFRARIPPFVEDFRIANPPGSYSGRCSALSISKNEPVDKAVEQVTSTSLQTVPAGDWSGFDPINPTELANYLSLSQYFLQSINEPIVAGSGDPTGGQLAANINGAFITNFYIGGLSYEARFAGPQETYSSVNPNTSTQETIYVIPVTIDIAGSEDGNGDPLFTSNDFLVSYNSVSIKSWFSESDRYSNPDSFTAGPGSDGIFEFDAFPLYPFVLMRDNGQIRGAEIHNVDLLGNISTYNPQWKYNFIDGNPTVTYNAGTNNQTGEINVNGVGSINQTPSGIDELVPSAFSQVNRLSSSQIDRQGESLLRPGSALTTLYINNETKTFNLTDVFGFDRKVITPDILNTEAVYFVGRAIGTNAGPVTIRVNVTYVEQL
jgi:hypothetical protein